VSSKSDPASFLAPSGATDSSTRRGNDSRFPPGVSGLRLLLMMPEFRKDVLETFRRLWEQFGDVVCFRGRWISYLLTAPRHVEHVLQTNSRNYRKGRHYKLLKSFTGEGLIVSEGEMWLRQRRLAQPVFHRQRIGAFVKIMTDSTEEMLERWRVFAERGEPIEVVSEIMRLTLGIVGKSLFSTNLGDREAGILGDAFEVIRTYSARRTFALISLPESFPTRANRRYRAALLSVDKLIYDLIAERRRQKNAAPDLLSMLIEARDAETGVGMNDRQLRDEAATLIGAGYETTTQALGWTWYLLSQQPAAERKLRAELLEVLGGRTPTFDDLPKLQYARMVFEEAMRLYPPVWGITRAAINTDEIGGYRVAPDSEMLLLPYLTHRHPQYWEEPDEFIPERFAPEKSSARQAFAYFPFGGGPRQCLGNNFALMEAQLIVAMVAQKYRLELVPGQIVEPEPSVTLRPRRGLRMTLSKV
jgi:cytochrome P450